ncbi:hypothetical protein KDA_11990 [Dictyobacter alpinus]|uniref:Uncharacterized protein n=1 Tax=Dictyobacter alpinus TaxID=2014873 RepID=A0A402B2X9_9CHLR|nr:hypothetical protein KDA_11990 [Dictyobacter alpinus]
MYHYHHPLKLLCNNSQFNNIYSFLMLKGSAPEGPDENKDKERPLESGIDVQWVLVWDTMTSVEGDACGVYSY